MIWAAAVVVDGDRDRGGSGDGGDGNDENDKAVKTVETCKSNLTDLRRILHLSLAKGNPK
jgi:hypothetical protein